MPQYRVWILPRWRDPLFAPRCTVVLGAYSVVGVVSVFLHLALMGSIALVLCVWPYRHVVRADASGLRVRWLVFSATIPIEELTNPELSMTRRSVPRLIIHRRDASQLILQSSAKQLSELHAALVSILHAPVLGAPKKRARSSS